VRAEVSKNKEKTVRSGDNKKTGENARDPDGPGRRRPAVGVRVVVRPTRTDRVVVGHHRRRDRLVFVRRRRRTPRRVRRRQFLRRVFRTAVLRPSPARQTS